MTVTKIHLEYLKNEGASLRKRKRGLIKKTHELTTLCGVEPCVIIYSPNKPEPATRVAEQDNTFSQQEELANAREQLDKLRKENKLKELSIMVNMTMSNDDRSWMRNLDNDYLTYMKTDVLEQQLDQMENRIALLNFKQSTMPQE